MEGILLNYADSFITYMSAVALLVLAFGAITIGYLSDLEKAGKKFFWTMFTGSDSEQSRFLPKDVIRKAA